MTVTHEWAVASESGLPEQLSGEIQKLNDHLLYIQ